MVNRMALGATLVVAALAAATPGNAQRRMGSQIGPLTFRLTANAALCLTGGSGWRSGSPVRLNPCGPADNPDAAVIYDNEFNYLKVAANPALCIMVAGGQAGQALIVNECVAGSDGNRAWSFTKGRGLWLRDGNDMCASPEGQAGGRVLLAPCRSAPAVWTCAVVPNPPALDGGWPAARSQEWCDR